MSDKTVGYLFHESTMSESEIRSIEHKKNGVVKMVCVLQEANLPNRNGRIYPKNVIQKALGAAFIVEKLGTNSLLGEAGHPANADVQRQVNIDQDNATHLIKKFSWDAQDSNILLGEVESAYTSKGRDWAGLIRENGMVPSFSMRGLGDVTKSPSGQVTVKDPLRIVTYDSVNFPSHTKAYMRNIVEAAQPIGMQELANYAARNSKNFASLNEQVLCIAEEYLSFTMSESGQLTVKDKSTGSNVAVVLMERNLDKEVNSALLSMMKYRV